MTLTEFVLIVALIYMIVWLLIAGAIVILGYQLFTQLREYRDNISSDLRNVRRITNKFSPLIAGFPVLIPVLGFLWKLLQKRNRNF